MSKFREFPNKDKFTPGNLVVATGNYRDEQQGEVSPTAVQRVLEVQNTTEDGTSGQWIKTDLESDWLDAAWFKLVKVTRKL